MSRSTTKIISSSAEQETERRTRGRPRAFVDKTEQNTIKSLDRSLAILKRLALIEAAPLSELARDLEESPATVYRVLVTMQTHGVVEFDDAQQVWHVGAGAFLIGSAFMRRTGLIERARPFLRQLMEATGETANLGVRSEDAVLFISQVETTATIRAFFPPGTKSPLHASGIGKVLLANSDWNPSRTQFERYTTRTIVDRDGVEAELAQIRRQGYAIDNEERTEGMRCLAAPIRNAYGETVAGLSVSGPVSRMTIERINELAPEVISAADKVSEALGARIMPVAPVSGTLK